jgi:hypothetical protein
VAKVPQGTVHDPRPIDGAPLVSSARLLDNARTMAGIKQLGILLAISAIALSACSKKEKAAAREAASVEPTQGTATEGEVCIKSSDCVQGLSCAKDETCQTPKTIECMGRQLACQVEGRCKGKDGRCVADSEETCKQAEICRNDGRCTPKDGKCQAVSKEDCAEVCKEHGRCAPEEGKCVALTTDDCKQSRACEVYDRCKLVDGRCTAK